MEVVVLCVSLPDEYRFLQAAEQHEMTNGEYVFITIDQIPADNVETPWVSGGVINSDVKHIYKHVLQVIKNQYNWRKYSERKSENM